MVVRRVSDNVVFHVAATMRLNTIQRCCCCYCFALLHNYGVFCLCGFVIFSSSYLLFQFFFAFLVFVSGYSFCFPWLPIVFSVIVVADIINIVGVCLITADAVIRAWMCVCVCVCCLHVGLWRCNNNCITLYHEYVSMWLSACLIMSTYM